MGHGHVYIYIYIYYTSITVVLRLIASLNISILSPEEHIDLDCFQRFWIDFFSIWIFGHFLTELICFIFGILETFLTEFFSLWTFWNVLILFRFYLAIGASLGHPLPTRPLFRRKRFAYIYIYICICWFFNMFGIDFCSIWNVGSGLNWRLFHLEFQNLSSSSSFLFGFVEGFLIGFFSIWLLGHPWGTPCQPDLSSEKKRIISLINYKKSKNPTRQA